jgi:hypothetical protein
MHPSVSINPLNFLHQLKKIPNKKTESNFLSRVFFMLKTPAALFTKTLNPRHLSKQQKLACEAMRLQQASIGLLLLLLGSKNSHHKLD